MVKEKGKRGRKRNDVSVSRCGELLFSKSDRRLVSSREQISAVRLVRLRSGQSSAGPRSAATCNLVRPLRPTADRRKSLFAKASVRQVLIDDL